MHKRILVLSSFLLTLVTSITAQQDPAQTHFIYNKMMFNPGSTGIDDGFCVTSGYRNQWDKVNGAPNTTFLNLEGNLSRWVPINVGLNFCNDAIGFTRQNNLMLNISHPLQFPGGSQLGLGLGIGMINYGQKPDWVPPQTMTDNLLPLGFSATGLDLNFGLYFKSVSNFYAGFSATHLTAPRLTQAEDPSTLQGPYSYQLKRHMFLMGGYKTNPVFGSTTNYIDAQMMLRTDLLKVSVDLNGRYIVPGLGYAGITYRTSDAIAFMVGFNPAPKLTIGYSYDLTLNTLTSISRGTHELLVKYCYFLPIPPVAVTRHVRWL